MDREKKGPRVKLDSCADEFWDSSALAFQTIHEGGQDFLVKGQATPQPMDKIIRYAVERKHAQAALLRSEQRYRLLFETIPHPICVFSKHTAAFLAVNQAALDHYGYSKEEFLRRGILDLNIPESVAVTSAWLAANDWGSPLRTRHRRKNGSDMDVEMTVREVDFAAEPAGFAIITDISERRRAEAELRRASAYNRRLIEASLDPLVTIGPDGKITDVNAATESRHRLLPRRNSLGRTSRTTSPSPIRPERGIRRHSARAWCTTIPSRSGTGTGTRRPWCTTPPCTGMRQGRSSACSPRRATSPLRSARGRVAAGECP